MEQLTQMIAALTKSLEGKKTYIVAAAGIAVVAAKFAGVLDSETMYSILAALGFAGAYTFRDAIAKLKEVKPNE